MTTLRPPSNLSKEISAGRLPWFNKSGEPFTPYIIGIAGGSGSGKTSVASKIIRELNVPWVVLLCMDSFYNTLTREESANAMKGNHDFDHPSCFDYECLFQTLSDLKTGNRVNVPIYDFVTHSRLQNKSRVVYGANVIIFEGIFALFDEKVRNQMDLMIYVDTDADIRLARRLKRDIAERGRDLKGILHQYSTYVKPSYDQYIHATMKYADIIIPRGLDNTAAIDVCIKHVLRQLNLKGMMLLRNELATSLIDSTKPLPENFFLVKSSNQLKFIHTQIRDVNVSRPDFIFYSDRLSRLVIEKALGLLEYEEKDFITPLNLTYKGTQQTKKIAGISIVRAGACMEIALRSVVNNIRIGKILIQTDARTGEPALHYFKLPEFQNHSIMLCDATLGTGAAALMAIRVLLEHSIKEEMIYFCCLIAAPQGVHTIANAFPKVKIISSALDQGLNDHFHILPGIGNFGDRYFGTEDDES